MPNSSSYWCPWCWLLHPKWTKGPNTFVTLERMLNFILEIVQAIKNVSEKIEANGSKRYQQ